MHLLIDLDGTLTDPFPGITRCIQHALVSLGRPVPSAFELRWCVGPPLKKSLATLLGSQHEHLADVALAKYRERFGSVGLFENDVYPGIEGALDELRRSGHSLCVATSKPTVFAKRIIDHFGLAKYFCSVQGSELDGERSDKALLIAHILHRIAQRFTQGCKNCRTSTYAERGSSTTQLFYLPLTVMKKIRFIKRSKRFPVC